MLEEFKNYVINDFIDCYSNCRTPNPCTVCNPNIKFKLLLNAANELGADNLATGHYADVYTDEATGVSYIKASASRKDQSYMLYRLPQEIVSKVMFPLALFENKKMKTNPEIAAKALQLVLPVLEGITDWTNENLFNTLKETAVANEMKNGQILYPVRIALSGKETTPGGATELAHILGKDETLKRIKAAIAKLA